MCSNTFQRENNKELTVPTCAVQNPRVFDMNPPLGGWGGGGKDFGQERLLPRDVAKSMRAIFIYLTAVSKSARLFPVSCENDYSAYIVNLPLYKLWRGKTPSQSASLQSRGNISKESRDKQEQSRPHQHTLGQ